jgi:hypothetical protein
LALAGIADLFEIAWEIKDQKMTLDEARKNYFGFKIQK